MPAGTWALSIKEDLNRLDQESAGYLSFTIHGGRRQSAAEAFLKPIRSRPNLCIECGIRVDRLLFEGQSVIGISGLRKDGSPVQFRCGGEVILSAGGIQSPKLLQFSDIGDADALPRTLGIKARVDLPAVGRNLRE